VVLPATTAPLVSPLFLDAGIGGNFGAAAAYFGVHPRAIC